MGVERRNSPGGDRDDTFFFERDGMGNGWHERRSGGGRVLHGGKTGGRWGGFRGSGKDGSCVGIVGPGFRGISGWVRKGKLRCSAGETGGQVWTGNWGRGEMAGQGKFTMNWSRRGGNRRAGRCIGGERNGEREEGKS